MSHANTSSVDKDADTTMDDPKAGLTGRQSLASSSRGDKPIEDVGKSYAMPPKHKAMFVDPKQMKDKLRENMHKPRYDVTNFYWTEGCCQKVARSPIFENLTLSVIAFNALWLAIDADNNTADSLVAAQPIFIVAENFFCLYFFLEWIFRFGSFKNKLNCMKDAWFVFDSFMVCLMIFETWIMSIMMLAMGGGGVNMGSAGLMKLLRLLRLSRMARMARLLRSLPDLLILIKGMVAAIRSVFFTLILLVLLIYVFAIFFRQMARGLPIEETFFPSMAETMHSLLLHGIFTDSVGSLVFVIADTTDYHLLIGFYIFVLLGSCTIMNMLIGVLCEVVSAVAATEQEEITIAYTNERLLEIITETEQAEIDQTEYTLSKEKFMVIFQKPDTARLLNEVDVDVLALVDLVDTIFANEDGTEKSLTFGDLVEVMLDQRTTNTATVKDLTDMRKYVRSRMDDMQDKIDEVLEHKEASMIRLKAQMSVLGDMVEKVTNAEPGTFQTKAAAAREKALKEAKEKAEFDLKNKMLLEESEREAAERELQAVQEKNEEVRKANNQAKQSWKSSLVRSPAEAPAPMQVESAAKQAEVEKE
eukprot:TRINITY_DN58040_c0_g1_i1.p1 TRINITY_DN58040_c0_g1~~TRINITY_DN58040_c0_g1_i1.p1  ORF type:complete len:588 (-),score=162.39 TRINITY_DN58040_c0_g1_i1:120-1883(-)